MEGQRLDRIEDGWMVNEGRTENVITPPSRHSFMCK